MVLLIIPSLITAYISIIIAWMCSQILYALEIPTRLYLVPPEKLVSNSLETFSGVLFVLKSLFGIISNLTVGMLIGVNYKLTILVLIIIEIMALIVITITSIYRRKVFLHRISTIPIVPIVPEETLLNDGHRDKSIDRLSRANSDPMELRRNTSLLEMEQFMYDQQCEMNDKIVDGDDDDDDDHHDEKETD